MFTAAVLTVLLSPAHASDDDARIQFSGDLRYRNEWNVLRPGGEDMRWRQRMRARLGAQVTIVPDQVTGQVRLRTGNPTDPNSPHQTMGNDFNNYTVSLDLVYMQWNPGGGQSWFRAGKQPHAFANSPVYSEFIWDADVNPDGVAAHLVAVDGGDDGVKWALNPAAYLTWEQNNGSDGEGFDLNDGYLLALQSALDLPAGESKITIANAFYRLTQTLQDQTPLLAENQGNPTNAAGDAYKDGFAVLDNEVSTVVSPGGQDVELGGRVLWNFAASQDALGWQAGAALPLHSGDVGIKPFGDVHAMQAESMYSNVVQDDHQVGLGYFGFLAGVDVKPVKAMTIRFVGIFDRADEPSPDAPPLNTRLRIDVNGKF